MTATDLQNLLHRQIPLAAAMDVRVLRAEPAATELKCALAPNHNHLGSAFGGSLSALMILASYCRLFQILEAQGHVLIKSSSTEFLLPVHEDLLAFALPPSAQEALAFRETYRRKGLARLTLQSEIRLADGRVAARMQGEFVGRQDA